MHDVGRGDHRHRCHRWCRCTRTLRRVDVARAAMRRGVDRVSRRSCARRADVLARPVRVLRQREIVDRRKKISALVARRSTGARAREHPGVHALSCASRPVVRAPLRSCTTHRSSTCRRRLHLTPRVHSDTFVGFEGGYFGAKRKRATSRARAWRGARRDARRRCRARRRMLATARDVHALRCALEHVDDRAVRASAASRGWRCLTFGLRCVLMHRMARGDRRVA